MARLNVSCKVSDMSPYNCNIYILNGDTSETLYGTFNWAIILQYFTILNYKLFCKRNGIPLGAHFIYLNSGSLLDLKMAKKIAETCRPVNN